MSSDQSAGNKSQNTLVGNIREVWGEHDDFEEGGFPYVAFLIQQDVEDMEADEWDEQECVEELADVCINAMRMLDERGYFPSQVIMNRLADHEMKGTDQLVSKYQERFDSRKEVADGH